MKKRDWLIPASLALLSLVPALGGANRLGQVVGGHETAENARFLAVPAPIIVHIVAATIYSFLGALQFSPGFRKHNRAWHRIAGRVLLVGAVLVATSGLWMTLSYPWPSNDGVAVFLERLSFGTGMLICVALGIEAIRRRRFQEHGDWMIRAYAIGMGAGTQVLTHLPWFILVDLKPGLTRRAIMMGLGWTINVVVAEWVIRHARTGSRSHRNRSDARDRSLGVVPENGIRRAVA
jgi:uncharacterized membrane protein